MAGQYQYSLVKRDIEHEFSDLALAEGVGLTPWGPLGGGFLSGKYKRDEKPDEGRIATTGEANEESWERRNTEQNWRILEAVEEVAEAHGRERAAGGAGLVEAKERGLERHSGRKNDGAVRG